MIELRNVTKLYGTVIGVNDIDLTLAPGAYGLLGPNGAGKTTLLNLLTGQLFPSLGEVRVFGGKPNHPQILEKIGRDLHHPAAGLIGLLIAKQIGRLLVEIHPGHRLLRLLGLLRPWHPLGLLRPWLLHRLHL